MEQTFNDIKQRLDGVIETGDDQFKAKCPAHDDHEPSLSVTNKGDKILLYCHTGCESQTIAEKLGYKMADLFKQETSSKKSGNIEAVYKYFNESMDLIHEKVRFRDKKFANKHTENGATAWGLDNGLYYETYPGSKEYSKRKKPGADTKEFKGVKPILYNLPAVKKAMGDAETIYIVEGEKDVDTLKSLGLVGTCNFDGASKGRSSKWRKHYNQFLEGGSIVIIPDDDEPGHKHSSSIAENLLGTAESVKIVTLPNTISKPGFDFTDYIEAGNTKTDFLELVADTEALEKGIKKSATSDSDTEKTDTTSISDYTTENVNALGLAEGKDGYIYRTIYKGEVIEKVLSNFKVEILEVIETLEETLIRARIGNEIYSTERVFDVKVFDNKNKFLEAISDLNFFFKGKEEQLQDIKFLVSKKDYRKLRGVNCTGFHAIDGKQIYVTQSGAVDSELSEVKDVIVTDDKVVIKSDLLEAGEITKAELKEIAPYLFKFNSLEITSSIWGTISTFFLKPKLFSEGIKTKHLAIYGEAGAGKSDTRAYVMAPFLGLDDSFVNCNNLTQFALNKFFGSSNTSPVVLEEYKPWKMKQQNIDAISDALRNSYDMASGFRGNANQGLNRYPLTAPAIIIGEEGQEETAVKERSMIINFSKLESRIPERTNAFKELRNKQDLLRKFGRSILNLAIKKPGHELAKIRQGLEDRGLATIEDDRTKDTVLNAILGIGLIIELFNESGLDFEANTGVKLKDICTALNQNCFNEVLDGTTTSKTVLDRTLEMIDRMAGQGMLLQEVNYTYVNNKSELALYVSSFYDEVTRYKQSHNVQTELITIQNQFTKQLRKTDYFTDYKPVKFGDKQKRCFVLNIEKLKNRGLELDNLIGH